MLNVDALLLGVDAQDMALEQVPSLQLGDVAGLDGVGRIVRGPDVLRGPIRRGAEDGPDGRGSDAVVDSSGLEPFVVG